MSETAFRVTVPQNLDEVFSIDNFKFTEIKVQMKYIFEVLQKIGIRMEDLDFRFSNKLQAINEMEKTVKSLTVKTGQLSKDVDNNYNEFLDVKESHLEKIEMNSQGLKDMGTHKSRIAKLEDDLIELGI